MKALLVSLNMRSHMISSLVQLSSEISCHAFIKIFTLNQQIPLDYQQFRLNNLWQDKTLFDFIRYYIWGCSCFELLLHKELKGNCIIIAYVVLETKVSYPKNSKYIIYLYHVYFIQRNSSLRKHLMK